MPPAVDTDLFICARQISAIELYVNPTKTFSSSRVRPRLLGGSDEARARPADRDEAITQPRDRLCSPLSGPSGEYRRLYAC